MPTDAELLQHYVAQRDEPAFTQLVRRHLGIVYSAALRQTSGRHALAEEIAQSVFTRLARKAPELRRHPSLIGWLYQTTRFVAIDAVRAELSRNQLVKTIAMEHDASQKNEKATDLEQIKLVLDDAMQQLKAFDRELLLLKYFQGLTYSEIGDRLDLSANTTRMRANRALEKLRGHLQRRGVIELAGLAGWLTAENLSAAPVGLAAMIGKAASTIAPAGGVVAWAALFAGKKALGGGAAVLSVGLVIGLGLYRHSRSSESLRLINSTRQEDAIVEAKSSSVSRRAPSETTSPQPIGQQTPWDAFRIYSRAQETGDISALKRVLAFDKEGEDALQAIYARAPETIRQRYSTPEDLIAFFFVADTLLNPVPASELLDKFYLAEQKADRVSIKSPYQEHAGLTIVRTSEGWKCLVPNGYPAHVSERVLSSTLLEKLSKSHPDEVAAPAKALAEFAEACAQGDMPTVARLITFEPAALAKARLYRDSLPAEGRKRLGSLEEMAANVLIFDALLRPYPVREIIQLADVESGLDDRVVLKLPKTRHDHVELMKTENGWKYVITEADVEDYLRKNYPQLATPNGKEK